MIELIFLTKTISRSKSRNHLIADVFLLNLSQCEKIRIDIVNMNNVRVIKEELLLS